MPNRKPMRIRVFAGKGSIIATHVGRGKNRRLLYISPWGAAMRNLPRIPANADLHDREYELEVNEEVAEAIRGAFRDGRSRLVERIKILT